MIDNKYKVIDTHCHIFPDPIAHKATVTTCRFFDMPHVADGTVKSLTDIALTEGLDLALINSVATTGHQVRSVNNFIAATVATNPRQLAGLGSLHVDAEDLEAEVKHIVELGLHGVKLHPDIQKTAVNDPRCLPIYELCRDYKLPILFHAGEVRYQFSNPEQLLPIIKAFPTLQIVVAHLGGWSMWDRAWESYVNLPNVWTDCSSALQYIPKEKSFEIIRAFGSDRVMFGTDFPMWNPITEARRLLEMDLTDSELRHIFSETAQSVFKLTV